jgi:hypothetical protein
LCSSYIGSAAASGSRHTLKQQPEVQAELHWVKLRPRLEVLLLLLLLLLLAWLLPVEHGWPAFCQANLAQSKQPHCVAGVPLHCKGCPNLVPAHLGPLPCLTAAGAPQCCWLQHLVKHAWPEHAENRHPAAIRMLDDPAVRHHAGCVEGMLDNSLPLLLHTAKPGCPDNKVVLIVWEHIV